VLEAVGLVATSAETGASVVFLQNAHEAKTPPLDTKNGIRYVSVRLTVDHVMASSSIPIFFPPRRIDDPEGAPGWYWDGGSGSIHRSRRRSRSAGTAWGVWGVW
jgi:predicted acylesterase/phospholipase RssA